MSLKRSYWVYIKKLTCNVSLVYFMFEKSYIWHEMKSIKLMNLKFLPAKCLLTGILFFSFITIAGYSAGSKPVFRQTGQIELVYLRKNQAANKTVLYRRHLPEKTSFSSHYSNLISLLIYNEIVKVKFNSHSKKLYSIPIPKRLFPINNIPQNSDESIFSFFKS
jgi:hypothetical protein